VTDWTFWETEADGQAWLENSSAIPAEIVISRRDSTGRKDRMRATVVTTSWVREQLQQIEVEGAGWAVWPSLLVVEDGPPEVLRGAINRAVTGPGKPFLERYGTRVD